MRNFSLTSKAFVMLVVAAGMAVLISSLARCRVTNWTEFLVLLAAALAASRLQVKLPGVSGMMSVNLPFILVAVAEMSTAEALLVGCLSTLFQCLPRPQHKFNWVQGLFNFANMALAIGVTRLLYSMAALQAAVHSRPLLLAVAAAGYYAVNSLLVAIIIGLTEKRNVLHAWGSMVQISYPYYLASAGVAGVTIAASAHIGWQIPLLLLPLMAGVFFSYRRYFQMNPLTEAALSEASQSAAVSQPVTAS